MAVQAGFVANVRDFGAVADGKTKITDAIRDAISSCAEAGGGTVVVPAGEYLTGPIELRSGVALRIEEGARIRFSVDFDDYPLVPGRFEGIETYVRSPLIYAHDCTNIAIEGRGRFDGNGQAWARPKRFKLTEDEWRALVEEARSGHGVIDEKNGRWWPNQGAIDGLKLLREIASEGRAPTLEEAAQAGEALRPTLVGFVNCRRVRLEGCTYGNSPFWNLHLIYCDRVEIRRVLVQSTWHAPNGDGIDLDSCSNVLVSETEIFAGDDGLCIKSGRDADGRRVGRPCENVAIENCVVHHAHGGIVIGSEMSGSVRNLTANNCEFLGADVGLRFKTMRGRGGTVENIDIRNIAMKDIRGEAILFTTFYHNTPPEPVSERTPVFRGFHIANVVCRGAKQAIHIQGLPEMPVEDVSIENATIEAESGLRCIDTRNVRLSQVNLTLKNEPAVEIGGIAENLSLRGLSARVVRENESEPEAS
ncbi:glycoside hydrolase family 28 protein [Candidatus Sumerlaeota bacterium]|nr:glycoside hydrolase family 28 protein [Candidatus Sumerlaeota bacterium]